jgi:tRNA-specific 2-thiouridylase
MNASMNGSMNGSMSAGREDARALGPTSAPRRVLVAMSGGVDSSVAAFLLGQQGFSCTGATMRLFDEETTAAAFGLGEGPAVERSCCSLADVEDARAVCARLGIPHYTLNFTREFTRCVVEPFVEAYQRGETPNPCIDCNRFLKFEHLLARALSLGFDFVATGHYARIVADGATGGQAEGEGAFRLLRGIDQNKDQSYVLYALTQAQLAHTLFPLGELTKTQVRECASKLGLATAEKPESQDICFVAEGDYRSFIRRYTEREPEPGPIVDARGQHVGTHGGLSGFTIGQRRGIGVAAGRPLYVRHIDVATNTLVVGDETELLARRALLREVNIIAGRPLAEPLRVSAKHRYRSVPHMATVTQTGVDTCELVFDEPEKALTPGQALVFYQGDELIGGGTIMSGDGHS